MYIITDWQQLYMSSLDIALKQHLIQHLRLDEIAESERDSVWQESIIIILSYIDDINIICQQSEYSFIKSFPPEYQIHIKQLLNYPEYVEPFGDHGDLGFIALNIWDDEGSGTFIIFDKNCYEHNNILKQLTEEI